MNKDQITFGVIGLVLGIILTIIIAPYSGIGKWHKGSKMMNNGNTNTSKNSQGVIGMDAHFIEQMIPHHEDAILMADLALEKSTHEEIKQLAKDIKRTQSEEITQMKNWYKAWYGKDVPATGHNHEGMTGMMHGGTMGDSSDIEKLKTATDFDKEFINEMIPHHQMAVMMAGMLAGSTDRPEMKKLAKDISEAQTKEIGEMRGWFNSWYTN